MATKITVYDPPMCCATGVCGTSIDPELARISADLSWLKSQGVSVERFNLSQQPAAFAENALVKEALSRGTEVLPIVLVGDRIAVEGAYPSRETLAALAGIVVHSSPGPAKMSSACCTPRAAPKPSSCR